MENDGFRTWGFVLYRCTYKSDSDWEKFMQRYLEPITRVLTDGNGADILARFAPTVFEDPSFEGASSFTIRDHFNKWATTAPQEEQGVSAEEAQQKLSGRYKFCIMADEECVQSVLNAPASDSSDASAFVRLVYGGWKPLELSDEEIAGYDHYEPEVLDPIEGCTERDVGAMRVRYQVAQHHGYAVLHDNLDWELKYVRAPKVGLCI
ncbi:hypothetical protein N7457_006194 [Penicillium paradoxum]|uniref:uncharacterized protein n=1 Tax=Penicillium paradoxum TaxID=176176 RepID=UPI0025480B73|nr:uncharacterized protein N7457_006194 [Penicillium paradoxum]KAJ5781034.1 hypothetical protein N7457_006194 [Penicillium paradoxum]